MSPLMNHSKGKKYTEMLYLDESQTFSEIELEIKLKIKKRDCWFTQLGLKIQH